MIKDDKKMPDDIMMYKKKRCTITQTVAVLLVLLVIAVAAIVGVVVWFEARRLSCTGASTQQAASTQVAQNEPKQEDVCRKCMDTKGYGQLCSEYIAKTTSYGKAKITSKDGKANITSKEENEKDDEDKAEKDKKVKFTTIRLNGTYLPFNYKIELWPRLYGEDESWFNGTVEVSLTITKVTDVIILHVDKLSVHNETIQIRRATSSGDVELTVDKTEEDPAWHFYKIYPTQKLHANESLWMKMSFNGTLNHTDLFGMYKSTYKENNITHSMVTSIFRTRGARRAFPCFDEPSLKATFDITLIRRNDYTSLSTMPIRVTENRGNGWMADVYETTVVMPTYVLAFVVSQYDLVEDTPNNGLRMRIWAQPTRIQHAEYAKNVSRRILESYESWTGIPYFLPKMDQIVVKKHPGLVRTMENLGMVESTESYYLYNPEYNSPADCMSVSYRVAHAMAHMWFGNLVTCHWWDNAFLNDGFATYLAETVGIKSVEPDWKIDEDLVFIKQCVLADDNQHDAHPVYYPHVELRDNQRKPFLDNYIYYKVASILNMMQTFMTKTTFKQAIRNYLNKYAYKTVTKEDLYEELQKQADADGQVTWDASKVNISGILDPWIRQANFPLVTVTDLRTGTLRIEQSHYMVDSDKNVTHPSYLGEFIWDIPVTYITKSDLKEGKKPTLAWLREHTMDISCPKPDEWKLVNVYSKGYYIVKYDLGTWGALVHQLNTDHTLIPVENRAQLIDDSIHLAEAGEMEDLETLRLIQYMAKEEDALPWFRYWRIRAHYFLKMFYGSSAYGELETYLMNRVIPNYNKLGWEVSEQETSDERMTRMITVREACNRGYKPCINQARALFDQFKNNPDKNLIPVELRNTVYCTGVAYGGIQEWDFMRSLYQKDYGDEYIANANSTVESALSKCAKEPHVVRMMLDFALKYNSSQLLKKMACPCHNHATDTIWDYLMEKWSQLDAISDINKPSLLKEVTKNWNSEWDLRKLELLVTIHNTTGLEETIDEVTKKTKKNIKWINENKAEIETWLISVNKQTI